MKRKDLIVYFSAMTTMTLRIVLIVCMMKSIFCKTSIITYPTVELVENIPLNSLVVSLSSMIKSSNESKFVLLNLNGYETKIFSMINQSLYTQSSIDREEFLLNGYCLDEMYCKIELHVLVNDGYAYWIIPIHIVE